MVSYNIKLVNNSYFSGNLTNGITKSEAIKQNTIISNYANPILQENNIISCKKLHHASNIFYFNKVGIGK